MYFPPPPPPLVCVCLLQLQLLEEQLRKREKEVEDLRDACGEKDRRIQVNNEKQEEEGGKGKLDPM